MTSKPSIIVDLLVAAWVVFVAVIYYGGYFSPAIGVLTGVGSSVYGVVLLLAVIAVARVYLRGSKTDDIDKTDDKS